MFIAKKYLTLDITHSKDELETVDLIDGFNEIIVQTEIQKRIENIQDGSWEIDTIINIETLRDEDNDVFIRMHLLMKQGINNNVKDENLI